MIVRPGILMPVKRIIVPQATLMLRTIDGRRHWKTVDVCDIEKFICDGAMLNGQLVESVATSWHPALADFRRYGPVIPRGNLKSLGPVMGLGGPLSDVDRNNA